MRCILLVSLFAVTIASKSANGTSSDWIAAPQPPYPLTSALTKSSGAVTLRLTLKKDGRVSEVNIVRTSGSQKLDDAARMAALDWRLNPEKLRASDLVDGRQVVVEFRRKEHDIDVADAVLLRAGERGSAWRNGGRISYPFEARSHHLEGSLLLQFTIGFDCHPHAVKLLKSSGSKLLDAAAMDGIQTWRAYPQFVGESTTVPVKFTMSR